MSKTSSHTTIKSQGHGWSEHPANGNFIGLKVSSAGSLSIHTSIRPVKAKIDVNLPSGLVLHSAIISKGTSVRQIKELADQLDLSEEEIGKRCGLSRPTLHRRKKAKGVLSPIETDLWARIALLLKQATSVFEDEGAARTWLRTPQTGLDDQVPLDLAGSTTGFREVEKLLTRIDYGVYA